ncbi:MAG: hypothetical protein DBX92_12565 [Dielma fastidiosa]|nr:MAG: hypothetical protein DBX92_12565 [Dielma fastidiosa]
MCNCKIGKYNTVKKMINQYNDIQKINGFKKRFKLFSELVFRIDIRQTLVLIKISVELYEEF